MHFDFAQARSNGVQTPKKVNAHSPPARPKEQYRLKRPYVSGIPKPEPVARPKFILHSTRYCTQQDPNHAKSRLSDRMFCVLTPDKTRPGERQSWRHAISCSPPRACSAFAQSVPVASCQAWPDRSRDRHSMPFPRPRASPASAPWYFSLTRSAGSSPGELGPRHGVA